MDNGQGIQSYPLNLLEESTVRRVVSGPHGRRPLSLSAHRSGECDRGDRSAFDADGDDGPGHRRPHGRTDLRPGSLQRVGACRCSRCLVAGCTVSRMAGNGITIQGGEADGLLGCDIHTIGRRATEVIGGDCATLNPGRHFVENCRIYISAASTEPTLRRSSLKAWATA